MLDPRLAARKTDPAAKPDDRCIARLKPPAFITPDGIVPVTSLIRLTSLTQHLFLQFTDRSQTSQAKVSLDGREALRTEISAALDGVKKQYLVYVLKKDHCVYDFMYIAADSAPGSRAEFERFVQGFATLE